MTSVTGATILITLEVWLSSWITVSPVTGLFEDLFSPYPSSVKLRNGQTFDYIVVGAGAGGSVVSSRLALAGNNVLLIEAGGNPNLLSKIPLAALGLLGSDLDWQYNTISNNVSCLSYENQGCRFSRGKALGGSTTINFMMYLRGNRKMDFTEIPYPGWTFEDLMPYFLRYEELQDLNKLPASSNPYHNTTGPMEIGFFDDPKNVWQSNLIQSFNALDVPFNSDSNAASQIGVSKIIGYAYKGERMSTARGYLSRRDVKKALKVAKDTMCTGVIIDNDNVAQGVTVQQGFRNLNLYAKKEVILSAGTIATPQLLMLSGIGHADHLKSFKIPVKADLPVGDDLTDHVSPLLLIQVDKRGEIFEKLKLLASAAGQLAELLLLTSGPLTSNGITDITTYMNTKCYDFNNRQLLNVSSDGSDCDVPNMQILNFYLEKYLAPLGKPLLKNAVPLNDDIINQIAEANKEYALIIMGPLLLQPRSIGKVRLASKKPLTPPAVYPNFLADEEDVNDLVSFIEIVEHLVDTPIFKEDGASLLKLQLPNCPSYEDDARGYWVCYIRHLTFTPWHSAGTVALGKVLDERLRVKGVEKLRVADLSALPMVPRANTEAVTLAIGERAAEFIMQDNQ